MQARTPPCATRRMATLLQTIGTHGLAAPTLAGRPFNMPTGIVEAPDGSLYVSDGYGNCHPRETSGLAGHFWTQSRA